MKHEVELSNNSLYVYTCRSRNELYGKPFAEGGTNGSCYYLWCKKEYDENGEKLVPFTDEEQAIKKALMEKYFGDTTEKALIVREMYERGEISESQGFKLLMNMNNMTDDGYKGFLKELRSVIGATIVKGTMIERKIDFKMLEE